MRGPTLLEFLFVVYIGGFLTVLCMLLLHGESVGSDGEEAPPVIHAVIAFAVALIWPFMLFALVFLHKEDN